MWHGQTHCGTLKTLHEQLVLALRAGSLCERVKCCSFLEHQYLPSKPLLGTGRLGAETVVESGMCGMGRLAVAP